MLAKSTFALSIFWFCLIPALGGAQVYRITDLGTLPGGSFSYANSVNGFGQVVGTADIVTSAGHRVHGFLWTKPGGMQDLGTLPGSDEQEFSSWATGINDFGQVTGGSWQDLTSNNVFLWTESGGMENLFGTPSFNAFSASINDVGQIASTGGFFIPQAALWTSATGWQDLGGYISYAFGINILGQVVGQFELDSLSPSHAFLWTKDSGMQDLGTLAGGTESAANGINAFGQIVGWSNSRNGSATSHAFLWTKDRGMQDLGTLQGGTESAANGINAFGQVVGWSNSGHSSATSHAFLWTKRSGIRDLNNLIRAGSGWVLYNAAGINVWGRIVGYGTINGQEHAFLLTPKL
jgi:probable HAF family extracellular repeat protein